MVPTPAPYLEQSRRGWPGSASRTNRTPKALDLGSGALMVELSVPPRRLDLAETSAGEQMTGKTWIARKDGTMHIAANDRADDDPVVAVTTVAAPTANPRQWFNAIIKYRH